MVNCVVVGCNNRSERGVRLYRFPNDPVRKKRWLVQVRRRDLTTANCKHNKLCEAHFETSQFAWTKTGKVRLSADAIPTIFTHPPVDKSWKETRKRRRRRRKMKDVGSHTSGPATSSANEDPEWDTQILKSRLQEEEGDLQQSQDHEVELCQTLRLQVEDLQKRLEEKDNKLNEANEVIRALRDEVQTLQQRLEQHRRSGDYSTGREGLLCWGARTNDLLTLVPVQPCVLTGTVPSDCRPSEPEPASSDAGTSHKDQDVTSQNPPLRPPLGTSIGHRTETRTVLSDCRPNEPELGSSDAGASHKDQDVTSQDVGLITEPEPGSLDAGTSHKDQDITSQDVTSQHPLQTNTAIKTEDGEIPVFLSCTSEDDPADAPASSDDAELTSPREPNLPVSSVKLEDCSQLLNLPVPSLRLLDCREMVGPDGIFKVQIVEDPSDEGDHGDNQQDISHQDGDGEGPSPSHGPNDPSFAEKTQKKKLKRKITQRLKGKTTQGLQRKTTQKVKGKTTQGLQRKTTRSQSLKSTHKSRKFHNCRECEETFTFPSQLFVHQSMHAKESRATATPHENTSTDSPNAGCLNTERYQVDHTYAKPYDENHNADTAHAGERPQLTGPTSTDAPTDSPKALSHQEVDGVSAILTPEPCTMPLLIQHLHSQSLPKRGRPVLFTDYSPHGKAPTDPTHKTTSIDSSDTGSHQKKVDDVIVTATPEPRNENHTGHTAQMYCAPPQYYFTKFCVNATPEPGHENHSAHTVEGSHVSPQYFFTKFKLIKLPHSHQTPQHKQGVPDDERGPYQCDVCGKILNSKYSLTAHKRLNSDEKPHACQREKVTHQCDVCGKILSKKESLISHKRLHTGERPYACKQCDRAFRHHSNFMKHQITHSAARPRFECDVCGKQVLAKKSLIMHKSLHADTRHYACKHCDKTFALHALLKMHMKGHTGEKRHGCTQCGKAFAQAGHLRAHMRTHSQEKPHRCSVCDKAFSFRRGLKVHSRMHTGERPYSCSQCPRSFPTTGQRRKHEVSHSDEKPYLCLVCGQRYKTRQSLQTHEWLHTGEKPFSCTHCNKAFRFKYLLAEHIRIHTGEKPYQCSDCGERFHTVTRLKIHQAHQHKKVNSCHVCGKAYSSVYSLKVHQRVHTGERPYQCSICGERFRNPVPLQTHRRKVHNIDSNNSHQKVHTRAKQANAPSVGRNAPTQRLQPQQKKE